jgi:predicted metal-binding protein
VLTGRTGSINGRKFRERQKQESNPVKEKILERSFEHLIQYARTIGASDAKLMDAGDIVVDPRSLLKCRFGCNRWGKYWTCQPNISISADQFKEALQRYETAIVIKCVEPKVAQEVTLAVEKKAMLEYGAIFSFAMVLCVLCDECAFPDPCRFPHLARPSMDGLGVDIAKTVEPLGFKVEFDSQGNLLPAWYSMVLLD